MAKKKVKDEEIGQKALTVVTQAQSLVIATEADYATADEILVGLATMKKSLDKLYGKVIDSARAAWKTALAEKARYFDPVDTEYKALKARMGDFKLKMAQERQIIEEKLYQEAVSMKQAEAAANPELAEEILSIPVAPVVLPNLPKTETVFRTNWFVEVTDLNALVKAVAEGDAPLPAVMADEKYLGERARSDKEHFNIPGCRAFSRLV